MNLETILTTHRQFCTLFLNTILTNAVLFSKTQLVRKNLKVLFGKEGLFAISKEKHTLTKTYNVSKSKYLLQF